jgi:hypothetical protein
MCAEFSETKGQNYLKKSKGKKIKITLHYAWKAVVNVDIIGR